MTDSVVNGGVNGNGVTNGDNVQTLYDSESSSRVVDLFIKASTIDPDRKGACPMCHRYFMALYLKYEADDIDLVVTRVKNTKTLPVCLDGQNFQAPSMVHNNEVRTMEYIEDYVKKELKGLDLTADDSALDVISDVYIKFRAYMKDQKTEPTKLLQELLRVDRFLEERDTTFLCGDQMTFADCELLPKLQHIRVAAKAYKDLDLPHDLTFVWKYLKNGYSQKAFIESCPADQDIIAFYEKLPYKLNESGANYKLKTPTFSFSTPFD